MISIIVSTWIITILYKNITLNSLIAQSVNQTTAYEKYVYADLCVYLNFIAGTKE